MRSILKIIYLLILTTIVCFQGKTQINCKIKFVKEEGLLDISRCEGNGTCSLIASFDQRKLNTLNLHYQDVLKGDIGAIYISLRLIAARTVSGSGPIVNTLMIPIAKRLQPPPKGKEIPQKPDTTLNQRECEEYETSIKALERFSLYTHTPEYCSRFPEPERSICVGEPRTSADCLHLPPREARICLESHPKSFS